MPKFFTSLFIILVINQIASAFPADGLLKAGKKGNLKYVENAIKKGIDVNLMDRHFRIALIEAIYLGHTDIAKLLIDNGAEVNIKDISGNTPLIAASYKGDTQIIKLLISHKADVNRNNSIRALINACYEGYIEITALLINSGADVNLKGFEDKTALINAVFREYADIVKLLIDSGADVNLKDKNGNTPVYYAIKNDNDEIVNLLKDHIKDDLETIKNTVLEEKAQEENLNKKDDADIRKEQAVNGLKIFGYLALSMFPVTNLIWAPYWLPGVCRYVFIVPFFFLLPMFTGILSIGGFLGFIPLFNGIRSQNQDYTYAGIIILSVGEGLSYLINLLFAVIATALFQGNAGFEPAISGNKNFKLKKAEFAVNIITDYEKSEHEIQLGFKIRL